MNDNLTTNASNEAESPAFLVGAVMRRFCSECEKTSVYCKGMCQACYSKMYRNTEKGKVKMIAYNLTKGKEAQRKYRERNRANKPPKPPKENCQCGKPSVSKNLCMNCYQRAYQRKKYGRKEGTRKNQHDIKTTFEKVLAEVKKGFTIERACKNANIQRGAFYRVISPIQKAELIAYRKIGFVDDEF